LDVAPCFKSQCFQQVSFSLGVWQEIMLGVYPVEVTFFSFFLASYDKLSPWCICLMGGHTSYHGLLFTLTRKKKFAGNLTIVARYGHPIRVQSNYVVEHSFVQEDMECANLMYTISLT
jgi:hypothetical protein